MLIAFYAPMKSPDAPRPSGDRKIARLFLRALESAGFSVAVASNLRSWEGAGDQSVQQTIKGQAKAIVSELLAGYRALPEEQRPVAWFTYHLYHKAPDWIGPTVSEALNIPYFVAEASFAPRQFNGPWHSGHQQTRHALKQANAVFTMNPRDNECITPLLDDPERLVEMAPFLDQPAQDTEGRHHRKQRVGDALKIDPNRYWLLCIAMMRDDSKLESYKILANALGHVERSDWSMLIVGDGAAQSRVRELFRFDNARRIHFLGRRGDETIQSLMAASDLLVWPAVNEAIGMVALESLACGLPVIWGRSGGIDRIVEQDRTGMLVDAAEPVQAARVIAHSIEELLDDPGRLAAMSAASLEKYKKYHCLDPAAIQLAEVITSHLQRVRHPRAQRVPPREGGGGNGDP